MENGGNKEVQKVRGPTAVFSGVCTDKKTKKRWALLIFISFLFFLNLAEYCPAIELEGVVTRHNNKEKVVRSAEISATNKAKDTISTITDKSGRFKLEIAVNSRDDLVFLKAVKKGLRVVQCMDWGITQGSNQNTSIRITMCNPKKLEKKVDGYRATIYDTIIENYKNKEKQITEENIDNNAKKERIAKLAADRNAALVQANELAQRFACVNLDDVSVLYKTAFKSFLENSKSENRKTFKNGLINLIVQKGYSLLETPIIKRQEDIELLMFIARLCIIDLQSEQAEKYYNKAIKGTRNFCNRSEVAFFHLKNNQFRKAIELFEEVVPYAKKNTGTRAEILRHLGDLYQYEMLSLKKLFEKASESYIEAKTIYKRLDESSRRNSYLLDVADTNYKLGILYIGSSDFTRAESFLTEAKEAYERLVKTKSKKYSHLLANALNRLGIVNRNMKQFEMALDFHKRALAIYEGLPATEEIAGTTVPVYPDRKAYLHFVGYTQNYLGDVHKETNNLSDAKSSYEKALKIWVNLAEKDPTYQQYVKMVCEKLDSISP